MAKEQEKSAAKLKTWRVTRSIAAASGSQSYLVKASSPEEAIEKHLRGDAEFEYEEIEVTSLNIPDVREVNEVSDTELLEGGRFDPGFTD